LIFEILIWVTVAVPIYVLQIVYRTDDTLCEIYKTDA